MILRAGGGLTVQTVPLGEFQTNAYVLTARGGDRPGGPSPCWVVDPGLDPGPLLQRLRDSGQRPGRILLTHGHCDHVAGVAAVKETFPSAVITVPAGDAHLLSDPLANLSLAFGLELTAPPAEETVRPGDRLEFGALTWQVLDLAGHTPGGAGYYCREAGVVLTGDALFAGSIGRCDIPGADEGRLRANIRQNLLALPDDTRVLPGHGPPSNIGEERRTNPFVR